MSDIIQNAANSINYRYSSNLGWFQFGGISSGLDTASIIDKILEVESQPLQRLNLKYEKLKLKRTALQEVDKKLEELRDLIFELKLKKNLVLIDASSADEAKITADASPNAVEGTYYVKVLSVATASKLEGYGIMEKPSTLTSSTAFGDIDYYTTPVNSTIRLYNESGDYEDVEITTSDTIDDIVSKINTALENLYPGDTGETQFDETTATLSIKTQNGNVITITQLSGNFMQVFHLDEGSFTGTEITSSYPIYYLSPTKTVEDLGNYLGVTVNDGTITINGVDISISTSDTLEEVATKITESNAGVYAFYDHRSNKFILTSKDTGNKAINVEESDLSKLLGLYENAGNFPTFTPGERTHLQISLDGSTYVDLYDDSRNVEYNGITFNAKLVTSAPVTVNVSRDVEGIKEKLKEFVDKWNEVMDYIYEKLHEEPVKGKDWDEMSDEEKMKGILKNDEYLRGLFERLKRFTSTSFDSSGDFHYLFEIGISSGDVGASYENIMKGHLEIDEDKLTDIINNNLSGLWEFIAGADDSFFQKFHSFLWDLTKFGGEIDSVAGTNGRIYREQRFLAQQIADWIRRLQKREEELWKRFSYMEEVLSRLQAQSAWLSSAVAGMNKK